MFWTPLTTPVIAFFNLSTKYDKATNPIRQSTVRKAVKYFPAHDLIFGTVPESVFKRDFFPNILKIDFKPEPIKSYAYFAQKLTKEMVVCSL